MAGKVIVTGFKELDKKLKALGKESLKIGRKVLREEQKEMTKAVKSTMPVGDTKEAKKAVKARAGKRSRQQINMNTVVQSKDPEKFHNAFVEFGTSKQPAQGTIRKEWESGKENMKNNIVKKLWQGIDNHMRGK